MAIGGSGDDVQFALEDHVERILRLALGDERVSLPGPEVFAEAGEE